MNKNGYLVISLDVELLWGIFDVADYSEKTKYFKNTKMAIPEILELFKEYRIHCTWAAVGMLFNKDWREWEENTPNNLPAYSNSKLSPYKFGSAIKSKDTGNLCFAPEIIKLIKEAPNQEIGTHTYSHYYCREEGQDVGQFRADLRQAVKMAGEFDVQLKSLVFPRNQFHKEYLEVCTAFGVQSVRTNPESWYWKNPTSEAFLTKLGRTGDAYNLYAKRKSYPFSDLKKEGSLPLEQKASRFLRPYETNKLLHRLKMKRIKNEMLAAAKNKEIYHLWWHPHNFGDHLHENLRDLKEILEYYKMCKKKYSFGSATMAEINTYFTNKNN